MGEKKRSLARYLKTFVSSQTARGSKVRNLLGLRGMPDGDVHPNSLASDSEGKKKGSMKTKTRKEKRHQPPQEKESRDKGGTHRSHRGKSALCSKESGAAKREGSPAKSAVEGGKPIPVRLPVGRGKRNDDGSTSWAFCRRGSAGGARQPDNSILTGKEGRNTGRRPYCYKTRLNWGGSARTSCLSEKETPAIRGKVL